MMTFTYFFLLLTICGVLGSASYIAHSLNKHYETWIILTIIVAVLTIMWGVGTLILSSEVSYYYYEEAEGWTNDVSILVPELEEMLEDGMLSKAEHMRLRWRHEEETKKDKIKQLRDRLKQ